jgi:histidine triad (HIT) family protein
MSSNCIFCKVVDRAIAADIVYEDGELLAFNDISPQAPVHVLIIPKKHIATVNDVTEADSQLLGRLIGRARALAAEREIDASGYRLILNCNAQGGQTVYHLHLHLLGGRQLRALG